MRSRTAGVAIVLATALAAGCTDTRDYVGAWHGATVGESAPLRVGVPMNASATLTVDTIDTHGIGGRLSIDGLTADAAFASVPGAEADVLAGLTWSGAPLRVYFAFVPASDGGGDLTALIALYDRRIELRLLRGGARPVYAIFPLGDAP
jgi:hypothetical protein